MKKYLAISGKKIIAATLSLVVVLSVAYLPTPFTPHETDKAEAFLGFGDIVIDPTNLVQNTVGAAADIDQLVVSKVLNGLAWSVAKVAIQSITRSTVNWINSGFQGSPAFISDLRENLSYLGDTIASDYFNRLDQVVVSETGFTIKSPFQDQINQQLRNEFYRTTASYGVNQYYSLYKDSSDPKAFIEQGKFSQGGFNAFFSASQNSANNPFGAYTIATNQLWSQIDNASKAREAELNWSKGFLPWRGNCGQPTTSRGDVALTKKDNCLFGSVKTPGSVIETQLENSLGSGIRQLELADSINEIVGALVGQMVNQVLGSGGISGLSDPAPGGGQSYINTSSNAGQYTNATVISTSANGILQSIKNIQTNATTFRDDWQLIFDAASDAQNRCGATSEIAPVVAKASANVLRANTALQESYGIVVDVQNAAKLDSSTASTAITEAINKYQTFSLSANIPSATELGEAAVESSDGTNARTGKTSLYTQMVDAAASCIRRNTT